MQEIEKGGSRNEFLPVNRNIPLVSIIIVTFNAEEHISQCLDAITGQSYQNLEVLVFDGKSTDATVEILRAHDRHISYWQSEPDQGIYDAMNKALHYASGNWYYFLGADDVLLPGFSELAKQLTHADTLYYGDCRAGEIILGGKFTPYRLAKMNLCQQAVFYPAIALKKYPYKTQYPVFADYVLNICCWGDRNIKQVYYPVTIAAYNPGGFSSHARDELFKREKPLWIKKFLGPVTYARYLVRKWKESKKSGSNFF